MTINDIQGNILQVRVTPRASSNRALLVRQPDGTQLIRVYVTVPAEDGKANDAVIRLLAKELHISRSSLVLVSGHTSRNKKIKLHKG